MDVVSGAGHDAVYLAAGSGHRDGIERSKTVLGTGVLDFVEADAVRAGHEHRSVHFDVGNAQIVVTERTQEPRDIGVFACVGLDPMRHRFLLLKSRMYCRPVFGPLCAALIECDSFGVTSSDYALFPFRNVRRPVYPLDAL